MTFELLATEFISLVHRSRIKAINYRTSRALIYITHKINRSYYVVDIRRGCIFIRVRFDLEPRLITDQAECCYKKNQTLKALTHQ